MADPVIEQLSGAWVPEKMARFIRLQPHPGKSNQPLLKQVERWGK